MELGEKLQNLRKSKGLTQEELADILYVSRTAVSKWESGRGYPSIDSLKEISRFFSISLDDLLSGEKLLFIAEKENKSNIKNICNLLFGSVDLLYFMLIILPLYPNTVSGRIYSVNLPSFSAVSPLNITLHWVLFTLLICIGIFELIFTKTCNGKASRWIKCASILIAVFAVIFLAATREVYAVIFAFLLLIIKGAILLKSIKMGY